MNAGELDRRVTLLRLTETDDGLATVAGAWLTLATVWAQLMPLSGQERLAAAQNSAFSLRRFKIRKSNGIADLNAKDRLVFEDDNHDIADVQQDGRGFLLIDAVARNDA